VPPNLKGEVTVTTEADLAGLGASKGPAASWPVPVEFPRSTPPVGMAYPPNPPPPGSPDTKGVYWVVFTFLLALVALLVSLKQARR
jgi:hypothetical protein